MSASKDRPPPGPHIDDLVLRSLQGELTELEEHQLRKWLRETPENEAHYRRLVEAWRLAPPGAPATASAMPNPADLVRRAERRRSRGRVVAARFWALAAAAAALLAVGAPRLLDLLSDPALFRAEEFTTRANETATVRLSDGSFVRLAPNSVLRVEPGNEERQLVLQGRAFFAVASDPDRPFLVRTALGTARALGTQFEVRTEGARLRLAVVEGRVALATDAATVEVGESQVSYASPGVAPDVVAVGNIYELLQFPGGLLVYQTLPLATVARELEYHFDVRIEITDSVLARREFTGSFANESFDEVLTSVCRATGAACSVAGRTATINPRQPSGGTR